MQSRAGASQRLVRPSPSVWGAACPHFLTGLCTRSAVIFPAQVWKSGILLLPVFGVTTEDVTPKTRTRFSCHQVCGFPSPRSVLCCPSSPLPVMAPRDAHPLVPSTVASGELSTRHPTCTGKPAPSHSPPPTARSHAVQRQGTGTARP